MGNYRGLGHLIRTLTPTGRRRLKTSGPRPVSDPLALSPEPADFTDPEPEENLDEDWLQVPQSDASFDLYGSQRRQNPQVPSE